LRSGRHSNPRPARGRLWGGWRRPESTKHRSAPERTSEPRAVAQDHAADVHRGEKIELPLHPQRLAWMAVAILPDVLRPQAPLARRARHVEAEGGSGGQGPERSQPVVASGEFGQRLVVDQAVAIEACGGLRIE